MDKNYYFRFIYKSKNYRWGIYLHTLSYWKIKRKEIDPIPLFRLNVVRPYKYSDDSNQFIAIGTYIFPFVIRKLKMKK